MFDDFAEALNAENTICVNAIALFGRAFWGAQNCQNRQNRQKSTGKSEFENIRRFSKKSRKNQKFYFKNALFFSVLQNHFSQPPEVCWRPDFAGASPVTQIFVF